MPIMKFEKFLPRAASVIAVTSFVSCCASRKRGTGAHSLVSLLIIMAVADERKRTPLRFVALHHVCETCERGNERNREPVARRFNFADLLAHVLRQVGERVALAEAAFRCDVFVAAGE